MKIVILGCVLHFYCLFVGSLSALIPLDQGAAPSTATTVVSEPAMDPGTENNLINQITSMQYAEIGVKIKNLNSIQLQVQGLSYISPVVQANYYAAATKVFSDLMATQNSSFIPTIRKFITVLTGSLSTKILDSNQKNFVRSYVAQLNDQCKSLTIASKKTTAKQQKETTRQTAPIGRVR